MGLRRDARKHQTLAVQAAQTEQWWEHSPGDRVRTIDGPGRVEAVHDGPYPGSEEYEIYLEGGLGGGRYTAGQIDALSPTQGSVEHTAAEDYPELGSLLHDRPDPAKIRYTATLEYQDGPDGGLSLTPAAPVAEDGEGQVMRDMSQYHSGPSGDWTLASLDGGDGGEGGGGLPGVDSDGYSDHLYHPEERVAARAFDDYHPGQTYLRFGKWPENERSQNNVTGHREDGVSVYDLDHQGEPMDPDPHLSRGHEHDESCEPDCDLDSWNEDYGNDTHEEMNGRVHRAEQAHRRGASEDHPDVGHLVKGDMIGIGHDGEPLLNNVRRVGNWIDHRHMFVPGAEPHRLARTPDDEDYEHPEEPPTQHTARQINGEEIDQHGSAPGWNRAANPNEYDRQSTEGEPDPRWVEDAREKQQAMASHPDDGSSEDEGDEEDPHGGDGDEGGLCVYPHEGPCRTYGDGSDFRRESMLRLAMPSRKYPDHPEGFDSEISGHEYENVLHGRIDGQVRGGIDYTAYDKRGYPVDASKDPEGVHALKVNMLHTDRGSGRGLGSAMMDHLYTKHPNAWVNHGYRTHEGLRWWNSYQEPEGHENRNVHNVEPHHWNHIFDPSDVARDIQRNEDNDPGHHTDHHDVDWAVGSDYGDGDDEYCSKCDEHGHSEKSDYYHPDEDEKPVHDPDPRKTELHHGVALHLSPTDHAFVHNSELPSEVRAHRLLDVMGRGGMEPQRWYKGSFRADAAASAEASVLPSAGAQTPATKVTLKAHPFEHNEVHFNDASDDETPQFETDASRGAVHFKNTDFPVNFHLKGMSWGEHGQGTSGASARHTFDKPEPVGMPLAQYPATSHRDYTHDNPASRVNRAEVRQQHQERYAPRQSPLNPPGTGEQQKLFAVRSSLPNPIVHKVAASSEHEPWREPSKLTEEDKQRLDGIQDAEAEQLDPASDEHEHVWGFRSLRPHEKHAQSIAEAGAHREHYEQDAASRGHGKIDWTPVNHGEVGMAPGYEGECADCGHRMSLGAGSSSSHAPHTDFDLRHSTCTGPGTRHLIEQKDQELHGAMQEAVGEFGRASQEALNTPHYEDFSGVPNLEHPLWGGGHNPTPGAGERAVRESVPAQVHEDDIPRHPSALSMLVTAAADPSFRFHVTAAWRDVRAKAKRIRSQGGVSIKHSDGMTVVGDVQGDHNVYETALQRAPGRRQSVAVYACGCKWGAYHWGAGDDLSRFAGRMCSHALALQYEAASRGMFGRDVEVDDARPRWVPSKVVVKYDIDSGQHVRATAAQHHQVVPEQPPVLVALAAADELTARVVTAAVNDMFGDTSGYTEPSLMDPMGPTVPWDHNESPVSAGPLKAAEPHNWGSITGPNMFPRVASAMTSEGFWQAVVPIVRAVAPKVLKTFGPQLLEKAVEKAAPQQVEEAETEGTRATLNDEPEGALPETDGDHTASLGDVDIANDHDIWALDDDALSPESPSIMTQGAAGIVAEFQRSAAAKSLMDSGPKGDTSSSEIAQAAQAYLSKTAGVAFTRAEQDALINESPGTQASNTDRLDIQGTHYAELDKLDTGEEDDATWMM